MVNSQIPGLNEFWIHAGDSRSTQFEGRLIPREFKALIGFDDKTPGKSWTIVFNIRVTDLGTPALTSVQVVGSYEIEPLVNKLKSAKRQDLDSPQLLEKLSTDPQYADVRPEIASVERWQLKVLEQYRFELFEMSLVLAMTTLSPKDTKEGTVWVHEPRRFTADEAVRIRKEISVRMRQKITPEFLKQVAQVYTEAVLIGENPVQAIMRRYNCAHRTASEYATKARDPKYGFLPETDKGKITVGKPTARKGKNDNSKTKRS